MNQEGIVFGYYGINEVYPPDMMVKHAVLAEDSGFDRIWLSDHFHPWTSAAAVCNFAWVIITAIAERTHRTEIGPAVTVPIYRYHPAVVAQAFATLGNMYPGRILLGLGSGEPVNEVALGADWPAPAKRLERFDEALRVIQSLFLGEYVTFRGKYFSLNTANLFTKPSKHIPLYISSSGPGSARLAGKYGDGVIIPSGPDLNLPLINDKIRPALKAGAREAGRDPEEIKIALQVVASYADDEDEILERCGYWKHIVVPGLMSEPISDPRVNAVRVESIDLNTLRTRCIVGTSAEEHIEKLEKLVRAGVDEVIVLSASPDEEAFLRVYGTEVLPHVKARK